MSKFITVAGRVAATIRFAQAMNNNSAVSNTDRARVFSDAQTEGVTTFAALRTHLLLGATKGNSELVRHWLQSIEFGDFSDNYEAYTICRFQIAHGEAELGLERLRLLRRHIAERPDELKSFTHLLSRVDAAIAHAAI